MSCGLFLGDAILDVCDPQAHLAQSFAFTPKFLLQVVDRSCSVLRLRVGNSTFGGEKNCIVAFENLKIKRIFLPPSAAFMYSLIFFWSSSFKASTLLRFSLCSAATCREGKKRNGGESSIFLTLSRLSPGRVLSEGWRLSARGRGLSSYCPPHSERGPRGPAREKRRAERCWIVR